MTQEIKGDGLPGGVDAGRPSQAGFVDLSGIVWFGLLCCLLTLVLGVVGTLGAQWFFHHFHFDWSWK